MKINHILKYSILSIILLASAYNHNLYAKTKHKDSVKKATHNKKNFKPHTEDDQKNFSSLSEEQKQQVLKHVNAKIKKNKKRKHKNKQFNIDAEIRFMDHFGKFANTKQNKHTQNNNATKDDFE